MSIVCPICDGTGLVSREIPGGVSQAYRCRCAKGEQFARIVTTYGRGAKKRERVIEIKAFDAPEEVVPPPAPPAKSGRDRAAGND